MKHNVSKWILGLLIITAMVFTTGFKVKKEHFGKDKTYAIVSLQSSPSVTVEGPSGGAIGLIKSLRKKHKFSEDASGIFKETLPVILEIVGSSKSFLLFPQDKVFGHNAYIESQPDKKGRFSKGMLVGEGYKFFKHKSDKKMKNLARALGVDGVIIMYVTYRVTFRGVGASSTKDPLWGIAKGKQKGLVYINIWAYNSDGDLVWKNTEWGRSEDGVDSMGGGTDFKKIRPYIIEATKIAAKKQINKLDDKVGG